MPFETSEFVRNGKYTDVQHLAFGAYGRVCSARDRLGRLVAVKELLPGVLSPQRFVHFCERFQREFKLQHSLRDDHIIDVIDLERDSQTGEWYSICELADEKSLADYLSIHGVLCEEDVLSVALDICVALGKIWSNGVVHRDVKPGNILLCSDPNRIFPLAKLGDFGSAYEVKQTVVANKPTDVHLTPEYAPPQFVPGNPLFDPSTLHDPYYKFTIMFDIYSLGITIWEMLTRKDYKELAKGGLPSLQQYAPNTSLGIAQVIGWALEDEPGKRYQSPEDLKADLQRVRDGKAPIGPKASSVASPTLAGTSSQQIPVGSTIPPVSFPPAPPTLVGPSGLQAPVSPVPLPKPSPKPKPFIIPRGLGASIAILMVVGAGFYAFRAFNPAAPPPVPIATSTAAIVAVAPTITNTVLPTLIVTPEPLTATPEPPTATPEPPSATPVPSTATPVPPTATPTNIILPVEGNKATSKEGIEITIINVRLDTEGLIRVRVSVFNPTSRDIDFKLGFGGVYLIDNSGEQYDLAPWFWTRNDAQPNNVLPNNIAPDGRREGDLAVESNKLRNDATTLRVVFNLDNERVSSDPVPIPGR